MGEKRADSERPFDIEQYLKKRKAVIDRELERYFRQHTRLPTRLFAAMQYGVFPGGKRLRPILTLAAGELFGAPHKALLPFACALELIHSYSLIHDDLPALDNDDTRRGEPASHKVFGEGVALLAGDALLTEAFHWISRPEVLRWVEPGLIVRLTHEIAAAAGATGMVGGQALDLEWEGREADVAAVEYIHVRKTGALILAAARVGASVGGASSRELGQIGRYARFLGLAFQITDDILDAEGRDLGGHGRGRDEERKKATYPAIVGIAAARARARELLDQCLKELDGFGPRAEPLRAIARYVVMRAV
jgi:geranylgeranyl diphosphate synthase type II